MLLPYAKKNGLKYNMTELLSTMKRNRIEFGLLLSPPLTDWRPMPNDIVLEICGKSDKMLYPIFTVENSKESVSTAIKLAENNKIKGFKILLGYKEFYPDDEVFNELYDYCEEKLLPVLFHTGDTASATGSLLHSHPINLDRLANKRPELKIVACHFGNPWFIDVAELIYKHENFYSDLSGLITGEKSTYSSKYFSYLSESISEAIHYIGNCDRILFGSDYPVSLPSDIIKLVMSLDITNRDKRKILYENAKVLFSF